MSCGSVSIIDSAPTEDPSMTIVICRNVLVQLYIAGSFSEQADNRDNSQDPWKCMEVTWVKKKDIIDG